jgi:multidrug efflux system outer membrane protein
MNKVPLLPVFLSALLLFVGGAIGANPRPPTPRTQLSSSGTPAPSQKERAGVSAPWWQRAASPELAQIVNQALSCNRELRVAFARLDAAKALREEGSAGFFPVTTLSAGFRRQLDSTVFFQGIPRGARDQNIFEVGFESAWELDLFGRIRHSVAAAGGLAGAAEADLAQIRLLVVAETARAYTELATAQAALPLQRRALAAEQESLRILCSQADEGKVSGDKIGPANAAVTSAQHLLRDLLISERAARNRLAVLGGGGLAKALNAPTIPKIPAPVLPADASRLLARRPDVQAAERRLAASKATVGVATAEYFPTVTLVGRIGAETNELGNLGSADANTFAFGPRLQWDLLNLHRTMSRVQGAKAQSRQALAAWEDSILLALEELDNALALRDESLAKVQEWGRTTAAMEEAGRVARLRAAQGRIDPGEALAVEQGALQAQLARLRAEAGLANATIFLQKACAFDR